MSTTRYPARFIARALFAVALLLFAGKTRAASSSQKEARVTQIIHDVKLLRAKSTPELATVNEKVSEDTSVRTGVDSRSELTFVDLTITRLGANTIFSFNKAGRSVQLNGGEMLLRVPKESGGAHMTTEACSVAITGTTVILEARRAGRNKLTVLEGGARLSLNKYPKESAYVRAGQVLDVPAGATKLPAPQDIDVDQVMNRNPLITDFPPLPSRNLIYASKGDPSDHVYQGQPVDNRPRDTNTQTDTTRTTGIKTKTKTTTKTQPVGNQLSNSRVNNLKSQPTPTPTPGRKRKHSDNPPTP